MSALPFILAPAVFIGFLAHWWKRRAGWVWGAMTLVIAFIVWNLGQIALGTTSADEPGLDIAILTVAISTGLMMLVIILLRRRR